MANISQELRTAVEKASAKYGIPVDVILGFAGLETSFGTKGVGKTKNNLFGIMTAGGNAKVYASIDESVDDFAALVTGNKDSAQSKKYGEATAGATTNEEWVNAIRDAGYNSEYDDGVYESKVMSVINNITNTTTETPKVKYDLKWWGDVVVVVICIIVLVGAVAFLGLSVTSTPTGNKTVSKVASLVKEVI